MSRKSKRQTVQKKPTPKNPEVPLMAEVGRAGLKRSGGRIEEEWQRDLTGKNANKTWREMLDNEPIIAATMFIFEALLRQTETRIEPADQTPEALQAAWEAETAFEEVEGGMQALISNALTMLPYGWAACEKIFKLRRGQNAPEIMRSRYDDGKYGWRKLPLRAQTSLDDWVYQPDSDEVLGFWQKPWPDQVRRYLPRQKYVHWRFRPQRENPEGYSLLRPSYKPYYYKKNFEFVEAVGIERYMAGFPVMEVPVEILQSNAGPAAVATRQLYEQIVREIRVDEQAGLVMPSELDREGNPTGYRFRLMSGGGNKPADVDPVIRRLESRMAMTTLSEVMLLGSDAMGSYSLSREKSEMLVVGLGSIMKTILHQINVDMLPELTVLNGHPGELTPTMTHGDIKAPNLAEIGSFLGTTMGSGLVTPDNATEEWARNLMGAPMSERPDDEARPSTAPAGGDPFPF